MVAGNEQAKRIDKSDGLGNTVAAAAPATPI